MSDPGDTCVTFHQYGQKCSALAPCRNCRQRLESSSGSEHGAPATDEGTRESDYYRNLLNDLFRLIQSIETAETLPLIDMIRNNATFSDVRCYIDEALTGKLAQDKATRASYLLSKLEDGYDMESDVPRFRPKVMDVHYLCDFAPVKVPAKPWTTVTDDDALVSHLVSLYFTWDYPFYAFVDREILIKHMALGEVQSDFCSPFLVNALLANACHYSQYSEVYSVPGDVKTKGTDFLAEAEKHLQGNQFEKGSVIRLASLQATLLLYERYSMVGDDDNGYLMLNNALEMAEALGIINNKHLRLNPSHMSQDMISSVKRTAWGLFQIDTIVHTNFLRPSRVMDVTIDRIDRDESKFTDLWVPYPLDRVPRPSWLSQCFDEACGLSYIARDISRTLSPNSETDVNVRRNKRDLHNKLRQWESNLPATFALGEKPPPHIILLRFVYIARKLYSLSIAQKVFIRMRYHALLINLYCDWFGGKPPFNFKGTSTRIAEAGALETALSSARQICALARLHKEEYGLDRAHQFAMYAVLLALFAFLEQQSFNVLDHDFLSLTSAFSIIARRSQVGMNIFHIFRHSVQSRLESGQSASSMAMPKEIHELFGTEFIKTPDRWTHYAESLQKLADGGEYFGTVNETGQPYAAFGIGDMLRKYESLTLGKHDDLQNREESSNFGFSPA